MAKKAKKIDLSLVAKALSADDLETVRGGFGTCVTAQGNGCFGNSGCYYGQVCLPAGSHCIC
jgi:hypothetical protein